MHYIIPNTGVMNTINKNFNCNLKLDLYFIMKEITIPHCHFKIKLFDFNMSDIFSVAPDIKYG